MKEAALGAVLELAEFDRRVVLMTGDLAVTGMTEFRDRYPDRFYNVGVAEQNMIGTATGLAQAGYIPYCYSLAPFLLLRPLEFIRNGPVRHELPVRLLGSGAGFEFGKLGPSHYGIEDIAVARSQPGLMVVAPACAEQAAAAVHGTHRLNGPVYFRLGLNTGVGLTKYDPNRVDVVRDGRGVLLLAMGDAVSIGLEAIRLLDRVDVAPSLAVVSTLNPVPRESLEALLSDHQVAMTLETHYGVGGLGSVVSEVIAEEGVSIGFKRYAISQGPWPYVGRPDTMLRLTRLDAQSVADDVLALLSKRK